MYVAESKRLTHAGAKKMMATAVDRAERAGIAEEDVELARIMRSIGLKKQP
ncbi:MAG: hypothetical protein WBM28_15475 [Burkholderiales bacterium]